MFCTNHLLRVFVRRTEREEFFDSSLRERGGFRFLASRERSFSIPRFVRQTEREEFFDSSRSKRSLSTRPITRNSTRREALESTRTIDKSPASKERTTDKTPTSPRLNSGTRTIDKSPASKKRTTDETPTSPRLDSDTRTIDKSPGIQGKDDRRKANIPAIRKTRIATTISYYYYYYSTTTTASTSAYYAEQS